MQRRGAARAHTTSSPTGPSARITYMCGHIYDVCLLNTHVYKPRLSFAVYKLTCFMSMEETTIEANRLSMEDTRYRETGSDVQIIEGRLSNQTRLPTPWKYIPRLILIMEIKKSLSQMSYVGNDKRTIDCRRKYEKHTKLR